MVLPLVSHRLRGAAAALLLALCAAMPAAGQQGQGTAEGVARAAADGAPLTLLLVRLLPAGAPGAAPRDVVTDEEGRFRFEGVPAGEYRLQVEQIGYERTQSPVLRVRAGETVFHEIRSTARPVQLEAITVLGGRCLTADQLADDPDLAALWNEAKKGVQTRRAFDLQYRYTRITRQDVQTRWRIRGTVRRLLIDTVVGEPDSVHVRERRRQAQFRESGYMVDDRLQVPRESDLLDDAFLRDHCLEPSYEEAKGAYVLRFRPVRPRPEGVGIRGAITVDADGYGIRRLEFEYLRGDRAFATSHVAYEDRAVAGSTLRLPVGGAAALRPSGVGRVALIAASSTFTYRYGGFERTGPE
jgi:hypothetical protein